MFRLRRLYFDSIGVAENRFSDLLVDFTDTAGEPTDTIVWLRNGAGKTTMLSLLLALVLPDRREFLATRTKKRTLEDLVLAGDTAHVVAEWVDPDGHVLLTGAVYEWDGRARPHDYNGRGKDRLQRNWWCVHPDPTVDGASLDDLPFTFRSCGGYDRERFCAHIRGLAALGVNAVVAAASIGEWHAALRERRFDPDLFRYFTEVNAAEGGMDGLFSSIDSPGQFVRYLLRFVGDQQRVAPVRDLLADTAVEIAKRPIYAAQRRFCTDAIPRVSAYAEAHRQWRTAGDRRDTVVKRAAELKSALLEAAALAERRSELAKGRAERFDGLIRDVRTRIDTARSRRNEYLFLAADFEVQEATSSAAEAEADAEQAGLAVEGWTAVEQFVELEKRKAGRDAHKVALDAAARDALPLVKQHHVARTILAAAVNIEIDRINFELVNMNGQKSEAEVERDAGEAQLEQAVGRLADLDAETEGLRSMLAQFEDDVRTMVAEGVVGENERLVDTHSRLLSERSTAETALGRLYERSEEIRGETESARLRLSVAKEKFSKAHRKHQDLVSELKRLTIRAANLADNGRLRLLLQTDQVDLEAGSDEAVTALTQAIAMAEKELVALGEEQARSERALHSLADVGLLPPRLAVEKAVRALENGGVTAVSGWRYLAENVDLADHGRHIAEFPEVVDGLIVYGETGDLVDAARLIGESDEVVVISSVTVFADRHAPRVVVGPAAAQHDKATGSAELERRMVRRGATQQRIAERAKERDADLACKSAIAAWQGDLPGDGMAGLRSRTESAKSGLDEAAELERQADQVLEDLREAKTDVDAKISDIKQQLARLDGVIPRVRRITQFEEDHVEPGRIRLAVIPRDLERARSDRDEGARRRKVAAGRIESLGSDIQFHVRRGGELRAELEGLPEPAEHCELPLDAAKTAVAVMERQLRENFPEESLRHALLTADDEVAKAAQRWSANSEEVRNQAMILVATPQAADVASRTEARARAVARRTDAQTTHGATLERLRLAQEQRSKASTERPRQVSGVETPDDGVDAIRLADRQTEEMAAGEIERHRLDGDRKSADEEAGSAKSRADMLRDQVSLLRGVEPADESAAYVPDDNDEVRTIAQKMIEGLASADSESGEAERIRTEVADDLSSWAGRDEFLALAEDEHGTAVRQLRDLFRDKVRFGRLGSQIEDLVSDLELREKAIGQQLAQVEQHKDNVVLRMVDLVDESLTVIGRASALSELPAGIGPWEHQRFLVAEARSRPSPEQIRLRVDELIDTMVQGRRIETDPAELLWRATEVAVPEGFRASVLKPAPDQPTGRTPVEEMRKWSGGENLTASLILFCVLARLRAERRTGNRSGTAGGVLPLDNPVGKANYLPFLDLQRRVAKACGVQLVFWTGLGDLGAVTAFPRIAALHKRPSATRPGRAYVQPDEEHSQTLDLVSAVRREP